MKILKKIKCGSSIFFSKFDDYKLKDTDWIVFIDKLPGDKSMWRVKIKDDDLMMFKIGTSKQQHIDMVFETKVAMKIGKFLIPEFNEYIGFTVDDLQIFKDLINQLDDNHKYQKIIYDSYIENNSFTLSDEQLKKAYNEYKKYRNYTV